MRGDAVWQHFNDHLKVDGHGDECTVYSYWAVLKNSREVGAPLEAGERGVGSLGYYVSRCVKIEGEWYLQGAGLAFRHAEGPALEDQGYALTASRW